MDDSERTQISGTSDWLVAHQSEDDPETYVGFERRAADGTTVWRIGAAELGPDDIWVSVQILDGVLTLHSWSAYRVTFDVETGELLSSVFTK